LDENKNGTIIEYAGLEAITALIDEIKNRYAEKGTLTTLEQTILGLLDGKLNLDTFDTEIAKYYTKTEIDGMEFISTDDVDAICEQVIQDASVSEVKF